MGRLVALFMANESRPLAMIDFYRFREGKVGCSAYQSGVVRDQRHETCLLLGRELAHTNIEQPIIQNWHTLHPVASLNLRVTIAR
jgi:hypothetical protein